MKASVAVKTDSIATITKSKVNFKIDFILTQPFCPLSQRVGIILKILLIPLGDKCFQKNVKYTIK